MKKFLIILAVITFALHGCTDQGAKAKEQAEAAKAAQAKAEAALAKMEADLAKAKEAPPPRSETEQKLVGTWVPTAFSNLFSKIELRADGTCTVVTADGTIPDAKYTVKDKRIEIGYICPKRPPGLGDQI